MLEIKKVDIKTINGQILWNRIVDSYCDSSLYQTIEYASAFTGKNGTVECLLFQDGADVICASVMRIYRIISIWPVAVYLFRGPMFNPDYVKYQKKYYKEIISLLKKEYVDKRKMYLRVSPGNIENNNEDFEVDISNYPNAWISDCQKNRTFIIDLKSDIEAIKSSMHKQWRYNLNKTQKNGLTVKDFTDTEAFDEFGTLYSEMHKRKKFQKNISISLYKIVQAQLPDNHKMKVALSYKDNDLVGGIIWSSVGNIGIPIFSATSLAGRDLMAGYQLRWHALCDIRNSGCEYFDQSGVDISANPGGYEYKSRMGGKEIIFPGRINIAPNRLIKKAVSIFVAMKNK